ncbi:uncharacterized protein LOC142350397 [Convolutriloba macropyga]|uniref:uncharacterized protein LOC142350397 n=1 Tax=Convolutriloba macropyga TaxID=536237 RepID=UPI003F520FA0
MLQRLQEFDFQVVHRPGDKHGNADGLSRQCSITPELTEAERQVMFGSCPSANSFEDALGRINLVTAEDANEPMSIQFQEDVNSLSKVAADILGPVSRAKTSGAKYILVLTDYFTKYVVCVPLERTTAEDVARASVENWVSTFGAPDCLHTDQGATFCSELLLKVCKIFGIEKTRTSPYHPQGNGIVERHNKVSKYSANNSSSWGQMIPYLNFVYNTTVPKTTEQTTFSLVFGQECNYPVDLLLPKAPGHENANYEFTRWLNEQFREAHMNARETLGYRQGRQKDLYQKNVFGEESQERKTSEVNYKISKDTTSKKWQIVHYNRLKPVKEEDELPRMETRSSHQEKWPIRKYRYDQEVHIEENNKIFTPEITSRRPNQESPFKWMDEDEEFFYDLFAEREHSTKRPTKTNIPAEPITPEQDKT